MTASEDAPSAPFDTTFCSSSAEVHIVAEALAARIEISSGVCSRRLSGPSRLALVDFLECVVVNLYSLHVTDPARHLAVPLARDAYRDSIFSYRTVSRAMKGLEACGYVHRSRRGFRAKGKTPGVVTTFQALAPLLEEFASFPLDPTMVPMRERSPLVSLHPSRRMVREALKAGKPAPSLTWPRLATAERGRRTARLRIINAALCKQFIGLHVADAELADWLSKLRRPVNLFQRSLHRVFTVDPYKGGRFAGAWWLTLPAELRKHIRMSAPGKPPARTVELDFEAMHFRMLYARESATCTGDPYLIYEDADKSRNARKAVKLVSLMMINASDRTSAIRAARKKITKRFDERCREHRPAQIPQKVCTDEKMAMIWPGCPGLNDLVRDIEAKHIAIKAHFFTGASRGLMFDDSEMAERIVLRMIDEFGVAPLPVHDSFIVRYDYEDTLRQVMLKEFRERMGVEIPISLKVGTTAAEAAHSDGADFQTIDAVEAAWIEEQQAYGLYYRLLDAWAAAQPAGPPYHVRTNGFAKSNTAARWLVQQFREFLTTPALDVPAPAAAG